MVERPLVVPWVVELIHFAQRRKDKKRSDRFVSVPPANFVSSMQTEYILFFLFF